MLKKHLAIWAISATALFPLVSSATVIIDNPIGSNTFEELLNRIINVIFVISIPIATIMIIVAGFYFITAAGEVEKINTAKKMILWVLIGFLVILLSKGIIELLRLALGVPVSTP